jgi:GAF domain
MTLVDSPVAGSAHLTRAHPTRWSRLAVVLVFLICLATGAANGILRFDDLWALARGPYAPYLAAYKIAPWFLPQFMLWSEGLCAATFAVVGLIIAWRGAANWMTVLSGVALMTYGATIPPPMHAIVVSIPSLPTILVLERSIGIALFVIFLYLFPTGRFRSWISISLAGAVVAWALAWPFIPSLNPYSFPKPWPFIALTCLLGSGVIVQLYRFQFSTPLQRQQTKWVVYGVTISVLGDLVFHLPWGVFGADRGSDLLVLLAHQPFFIASQLAVPISIAFSVLYYHLWEVDLVLSRTLVYGLLTSAAVVFYAAAQPTAYAVIRSAFGSSAAKYSEGVAIAVTGLVLKPMYDWLKATVDRKMRPDDVDLNEEFPEFASELRGRIPLTTLLEVLVRLSARMFDVSSAVVYLNDGTGELRARASWGKSIEEASTAIPGPAVTSPATDDGVIFLGSGDHASVAVPLVVSRPKFGDVIGALVLGERVAERGYSATNLTTLKELGTLAGTAIYFASPSTTGAPP